MASDPAARRDSRRFVGAACEPVHKRFRGNATEERTGHTHHGPFGKKKLALLVMGSRSRISTPFGGITGRDDRRCIWAVDTASVFIAAAVAEGRQERRGSTRACSPTPCQWGNIPGTVFGTNVSSPTGNSFEANWNFGFSRTVLLATVHHLLFTSVLTVQEFTTFTDHSGRSNFEVTETFVRSGSSISPTLNGTAATNYPLGASVSPASNLLGVWVNTSPSGANIRKIIISFNPNGTLRVRAFGNCVPTLCPWGKVTGITFGTSISSMAGQVFLAPYQFGFANKLVDGTVNATGTQLTVQTYTEFTDGSGRSNYVSADTFSRI